MVVVVSGMAFLPQNYPYRFSRAFRVPPGSAAICAPGAEAYDRRRNETGRGLRCAPGRFRRQRDSTD
ncbi:MAG: hypothetical protein Tsb0032_37570 [Kiloniellaceae bacterium]